MASRIGARDHYAVGALSELVQYAHNTGWAKKGGLRPARTAQVPARFLYGLPNLIN